MSNLKPDSVIAFLDCPEHVQAVLDASMWASKSLQAPLGLLHASPSVQLKEAIDYSGCLVADDENFILNKLTLEEKESNDKLRSQGRLLLAQAQNYCKHNQGRYEHKIYNLHRHSTVSESLDYVDDTAQLVVLGHQVTCKDTLSQLIRAARCPALVTHKDFKPPKSALFAFDNSPTCLKLLDWMCHSPLVRNLNINIVMVGADTDKNKDALREAYARLKQSGVKCKKALIQGHDISSSLIYYQREQELDILITGAFGESRIHEFIYGSDTRKLLKATKTPYLLYPKI